MAGITGFNPGLARSNINSFNERAQDGHKKLGKAISDLFEGLSEYWASPKAQEFDETYRPKAMEMLESFYNQYANIVRGAVQAYNFAASAHGAGGISVEPLASSIDSFPSLLAQKDGVIGMSVEIVRDNIVPTFMSNMASALNSIESLPASIALYDDEDGQRHAYSTHVNTIISQVNGLGEEILRQINNAINEQTIEITLAKQQSMDSLSG